jgi:hypothetical protein
VAFGGDGGLGRVSLRCGGAALELDLLVFIQAVLLVSIRTRVRRAVFPEPLGPRSSIEGRVVRPLARKTNECRKRGMLSTSRVAIRSATGDGLNKASPQSDNTDIMPLFPSLKSKCCRRSSRQLNARLRAKLSS